MFLPPDHPLSEATLTLVRGVFSARDTDFKIFFNASKDDFVYDLHQDGAVALRLKPGVEKRKSITLSPKAYFKAAPMLNVNAKRGRILIGARAHLIDSSLLSGAEGQLLANAKVKEVRKELRAQKG